MRPIELNENDVYTKCPKCGNNTRFVAHSMQVGIDTCNVWVECICGYDPTEEDTDYRYEDVWGGTGNVMIFMALNCWNEKIMEDETKK